MGSIIRTFKHTGLLSTVAWLGKQRFNCPYFCGKAGRGFLALTAVPSRVRILLDTQEPCTLNWGGYLADFMRAVLLSIFGVVFLRDECTVNLPRPNNYTSLLTGVAALNEIALRPVHASTPGEGFFIYRYFLSKEDEEPRLVYYDGGKIPTTKVPLRISKPWTKVAISRNKKIELGDGVLVHFRQIGANTSKKENIWVVERPKDEDIVGHAKSVGNLILSELSETAIVLICFAIIGGCFGSFDLRLISLLSIAIILTLEATLWLKISDIFFPSSGNSLAQDGFFMLHLILCSQAGSILARQKVESRSFVPLPEYVDVTLIEESLPDNFKVLARTRVEVRHLDDPNYGPHFRTSTMPYTTGLIFYLTLAHGFFWCLSTTLLPNYKYDNKVLVTIAVISGLLKYWVPISGLPWLAGTLVFADSFLDFVGFRQNKNFNPRNRPFRDLPQVLSAIGIFGAIYDALKI